MAISTKLRFAAVNERSITTRELIAYDILFQAFTNNIVSLKAVIEKVQIRDEIKLLIIRR